ncbi:LuxR family transcriptional regulator [Mycolicibacterium sp. P1-5]|uniref:helix-turn-helix transcriptional regulator n=1 Tax=Mycolicibacterium sp. P1-5 TaxID=2024617 RepID=UPI0011ED7DFA|nr:LuxR family transcriptional regulator [Mycolicibacterium sp. P1-5]KAA0109796.1 helix-turn-helix transcriptional regulator [Mycolicibacterium sp. P1-5]
MWSGRTGCLGRDAELAALAEKLPRTADAGLHVVAVLGQPGMGKTTLTQRLVATAEEVVSTVMSAKAAPWETDLDGGVLAQLLDAESPADPVAAAAALADRVREAGSALIVIDDAEHADPISAQALSTLRRHYGELPVLVVLAATHVSGTLSDVTDHAITLAGLSEPAVAELAVSRGRTLHPAMTAELVRHTGGNPRDVLALLDEVPDSVWAQPDAVLPTPSATRARTSAHLDQCTPQAVRLVEALAILGGDETLSTASALADIDDPLPALDSAVAAGLLVTIAPFTPRVSGSGTAGAVVELMGVARAAAAHRRAADLVDDPVRRLVHLVAATPLLDSALADEVAALAHDRGADGAWSQAAALFADSARLSANGPIRDDRVTRAVDALIAAGDCIAAAAKVSAVENLRETPLRNAVLAYLAILRGRTAEAEVRLDRAWGIVNVEREPDTAALIAQRRVLHALIKGRGEELVSWADRALELADPDSSAAIESAAIRGLGLLAAGHPRQAMAAYTTLGARIRHGAQAQRVTMGRGWVRFVGDDVEGARADLESAVAAAELGGSRRITMWALGWLARLQFAVGEWDRAMDSVEHGRRLASVSGIVVVTPLLEWTAAQISALRGDWAGAESSALAASAVSSDYAMMAIPALLARAQIAEAEADYPKARRIAEPLIGMAPGTSLQEPGYWPWPDLLANAMVLAGQLDEADAFLQPHELRAAARRHRSAQARLGYARGRWHGARGDIHAARRSFETSLDLLSGLPLRYDTARVNFAFGQTLRRAGKRRQADAAISTARELYLALGATTYVARCDRELKAGGLHQNRSERADVVLTPQEEAVSALVAQGLSNREVAAELFVSAKTVQYHLTRIYAKLGVRSRTELAAVRR